MRKAMAKTALVLVFSLVLLLSIRSVLGSESPTESGMDQISQAASTMKDKAESFSKSAANAMEDAKDNTKSWADWAKDKLEDWGFKMDDSPDKATGALDEKAS